MNFVSPPPPQPLSPTVLPVLIGPLDRVTIKGIAYGNAVPIGDAGYTLTRLDSNPPLTEDFSQEDLQRERGRPGYRFDRNYFAPTKAASRLRTGTERLADLLDHELPKVMWRLEWCTRFLHYEVNGKTSRSDAEMKAIIPVIHAEVVALDVAKKNVDRGASGKRKQRAGSETVLRQPPCGRTLLDWVNRYEDAGFNPCELRDNTRNSGNRNFRLNPEIARLMWKHAVAYAARHRPTKKKQYQDLCLAIDALPENAKVLAARQAMPEKERADAAREPLPLPYPSDKTFYAVINGLDKFDVYAGRYGIEKAKMKFAMVGAGLDVTRPFQRIEIDEWRVNLMVLLIASGQWELLSPEQRAKVARVRLWLCAAIDCVTRCIVGMRFARSACSANVLATLRMVVSDKGVYADNVGSLSPWDMHATPEMVVSDSGTSFIADETQAAILDLTSAPKIPPVGLAPHRARIERVFGTVHSQLISRFSGQTFRNVADRGDYNASAMANLEVDEIAWAAVRYVVDVYHNMPHEGLAGETPRRAWLRLSKHFKVIEPPDADKLRAIFGIKRTYKIRAGGVHVLALAYNSEELEAYRRRVGDIETDVRLDPENIGHVSVWVGEEWLTVPCVWAGFDRVTARAWMATLGNMRLRFAHDAAVDRPIVMAALREFQALDERASARTGIGSKLLTAKEIDLAEHNLALGFRIREVDQPDEAHAGGGLFDGAIPVGDAAPQEQPISEPVPPNDTPAPKGGDTYSIED
jgi:putative transposase